MKAPPGMSQAQRTPQPLPRVRNTSSGNTTPRSLQQVWQARGGRQHRVAGGRSAWRASWLIVWGVLSAHINHLWHASKAGNHSMHSGTRT